MSLNEKSAEPVGFKIAAVIACAGRLELLEHRALASIKRQQLCPEVLIIVADGPAKGDVEAKVRYILAGLWPDRSSGPEIIVLSNRRTQQSASGAWNSALDELCRRFGEMARRWYVAVLDDDDAWATEHLIACQQAAEKTDADMIIAGLVRHEEAADEGRAQSIPAALVPSEIFVKNPHVQGSNLFVRLSRLLEAGGFDENLPSCTDRDLCLRLARLDDFRSHSLAVHTVHHYADRRADRLTIDRRTKGEGLRRFYAKHAADFSADAGAEFWRIAEERFGFSADDFKTPQVFGEAPTPPKAPPAHLADDAGLHFVLGVATDSALPAQAARLFAEIAQLPSRPGVLGVGAVLLENGPADPGSKAAWVKAVDQLSAAGVQVRWITPDEIMEDWAPQQAIVVPDARDHRLPIAISRSILNYYVYDACKAVPGSVAWILDDDKTFAYEVRAKTGEAPAVRSSPDVAALLALRSEGVDVVIGQDAAAAPLPFEATLRLQLLDLDHALGRLAIEGGATQIAGVPEQQAGYYDFSRETRYFETPLSTASLAGLPPEQFVSQAAESCRRMRAGESVTRPLMIDEESLPLTSAQESIMRGGSTVFFKPEQLMLCTQYSAKVGPTWVRRSDMLHSLVLARLYGVRIVMHASVAVRHGREYSRPVERLTTTLAQDILGYGFYRGAEAVLPPGKQFAQRGICGVFYEADHVARAAQAARKAVRERLAATELSAWRVQGLVGSCLRRIRELQGKGLVSKASADRLAHELLKIKELVAPEGVRQLAAELGQIVGNGEAFALGYRKLELDTVAMQSNFKTLRTDSLLRQRAERARAILGLADDVEMLGVGWEGVVFRQGQRALKLIDIAKPSRLAAAMPALRRIEELPADGGGLQRISLSASAEGLPVIERSFVNSDYSARPSVGQLFRLLEQCRQAGVVFLNLSPANLALQGGEIVIIDYGLDFRVFEEKHFESMARKAWLCARFWLREDLRPLLSRSLREPTMPELEGFQEYWDWHRGDKPSATAVCDNLVRRLLQGHRFDSLLDYGCGKQAFSARKWAAEGKEVVGYDPGEGVARRWKERSVAMEGLRLTDCREEALLQGPYDVVLCSLVLCEVRSEASFRAVVTDLAVAVRASGKVILVICDPVSTFGGPTAIHRHRDLPETADYACEFEYQEVAESGRARTEHHRSVATLKRALMAAGLGVRTELRNLTYDADLGLPATDFIAWECTLADLDPANARVSLVIKASAMEAASLEPQVSHLIEQLEQPRGFFERILAIDSRSSGFLREYGSPDLAQVVATAQRLQAQGLIDRIIIAPADDSEDCAALNRRWFGQDAKRSHSAKGAPVVSALGAFEACQGEYILQVDVDLLVRREQPTHDFVGEAIRALRARPGAFTVSLNILNKDDASFETHDGQGIPFRVECRGCLFDRKALFAAAPFPNHISPGGHLELAWHRAMDEACRQGKVASLRGGSRLTGFVHPSNAFKQSADEWNLVMAGIEQGACFHGQLGKVELVGSALEWLPRPRAERFIFVVTGRNVSYGKMLRCFESMRRQREIEWGAVVIDDGSCPLSREACRRVFGHAPNITLLQPRRRRGQLANTVTAIRSLCADPEAVIVTLDMDDALIGDGVLLKLAEEYRQGADVTVGSMVRTDKSADYPATFGDLQAARGGRVWQHLRSFRKRLFDAIPDWRLRLDGRYVTICVDWAFMVPIAEAAQAPRYLTDRLYYYESSGLGKAEQRAEREASIARLMKRYRRGGLCQSSSGLLTKEEIMTQAWKGRHGMLILRHADRPSLKGLGQGADEVSITEKGRAESRALGGAIGHANCVVASGVLRARQTAQEIMEALGHEVGSLRTFRSLCRLSANREDRARYDAHKSRLGWHSLVDAWIDGAIDDPGAMLPSHESVMGAVRELMAPDGLPQQELSIVVTHDFYVHALLEVMAGRRQWRGRGIPTLAGVFLAYDDARYLIQAYDA